jgi:hypothetical protein
MRDFESIEQNRILRHAILAFTGSTVVFIRKAGAWKICSAQWTERPPTAACHPAKSSQWCPSPRHSKHS